MKPVQLAVAPKHELQNQENKFKGGKSQNIHSHAEYTKSFTFQVKTGPLRAGTALTFELKTLTQQITLSNNAGQSS